MKKRKFIFKTVSTLLLLSFVLASVCAALSSSVSELAEKAAKAAEKAARPGWAGPQTRSGRT